MTWPCVLDGRHGVDFTMCMDSSSLTTLSLERDPQQPPDALTTLRVPASMRRAFEGLLATQPEAVRHLCLRQTFALLRDAVCMEQAGGLPQGLGAPPPLPEEVCAVAAPDFAPDDAPVRCGLSRVAGLGDTADVWTSEGDVVRGQPRAPLTPWLDAMGLSCKTMVRQCLERWRETVDARNQLAMYVPAYVLGTPGAAAVSTAHVPSFGKFYGLFSRLAQPPPPAPVPAEKPARDSPPRHRRSPSRPRGHQHQHQQRNPSSSSSKRRREDDFPRRGPWF